MLIIHTQFIHSLDYRGVRSSDQDCNNEVIEVHPVGDMNVSNNLNQCQSSPSHSCYDVSVRLIDTDILRAVKDSEDGSVNSS